MLVCGDRLPEALPCPTLAASIELACTAWSWRASREHAGAAAAAMQRWRAQHRTVSNAWQALVTVPASRAPDYGAHATEICAVTDATALAQLSNRFRKSLVEFAGFPNRIAQGLAGALSEMVDNVLEHSRAHPDPPARGIVGYEVRPGRFSFAVGDVGRGALASLQENPAWSALPDDERALEAIIMRNASRRVGSPGTGFATATRAVADFGRLRIRSGSAVVEVASRPGWGARVGTKYSTFPLVGLNVDVAGGLPP